MSRELFAICGGLAHPVPALNASTAASMLGTIVGP
jgi:hypothetical protein